MWDPGLYAYTWMPGDGLFMSPFGYGFYSPYYLYGGGFIYPGYGFGGGYYRTYGGGYGNRGGQFFHGRVESAPMPRATGNAGFSGGGNHGGGGFHGGGGRR